MRKLISGIAMVAMLSTSACSTNGGMYSASNPQHNEFSGWKTAGAVLLGVLTLGAVGVGAYAGAQNSHSQASSSNVVFVSGDNYRRTYLVNGEYVTCYRTYGSTWNCY